MKTILHQCYSLDVCVGVQRCEMPLTERVGECVLLELGLLTVPCPVDIFQAHSWLLSATRKWDAI